METECFIGAVFRAAQRRDWTRLEFTKEREGVVRLRLHNLLQEIDSIDHLNLLRIEHDANVEVYPTEDGRLIAAVPQASLRRARTFRPLFGCGTPQSHALRIPMMIPIHP